jgi:hypothetical protein
MVHARVVGALVERARHVDDERTPVDGAPLELEEPVQARDVPLRQALEEHAQYLGGDARVGQGARCRSQHEMPSAP